MDSKSTEAFNAAFVLLDTSGKNRVQLTQIQDFVVATGAKIGDPSVVAKLFRELDTDGAAEIDSSKFLSLCKKLEAITNVSVKSLVDKYVEVEYRRLFALVVDCEPTKAGGSAKEHKIHKDEFRRFIGDCERVLSVSIADVSLLLRDFPDSLDFRCFAEIIARLIKGKSISAIVNSFTEAINRRRENRQLALSRFQGATSKVTVTNRFRSQSVVSKAPPKALEEIFEDAFQLLDSRGGGVVSLDAVYEFCESFPTPPPQSTIRKIYNQFDTDGSGDIDRDEFQAFCKGLEQAVNIPMTDMCTFFTQALFKRLYELVDEEGDGNDTVSKEELRQLLEAIRPALSSKLSGSEIYAVIREQEGDLNFDDFCHVIGKLTAGVSISKVVTVFEQQLRKRRAAKRKALQQFESGVFVRERSQSAIGVSSFLSQQNEPELSGSSLKPFCIDCAEKDDKIKRLESEMERVRSEMQNLKNAIDSEHRSNSNSSILREDELQGDIVGNLHVLPNPVHTPFYHKFPRLVQPANSFAGAERLLRVNSIFQENFRRASIDVDGIAKQINNNIQQLIGMQKQLQLLGDSLLDPLAQACQAQSQLVGKIDQFQRNEIKGLPADFSGAMELAASSRAAVLELGPDIECILDVALQERRELAHLAFVAAASSGSPMQLVTLVVSIEQSTQRLCDFFTLALRVGSSQLSDAEIYAKRIMNKALSAITPGDVDRLRQETSKITECLSINCWSSTANQAAESLSNMKRVMTTISMSKREKAVMTVAEDVTLLPTAVRGDPNATQSRDFAYVAERSTSPRIRARRDKPRDILAHVDSLLAAYKRPDSGVQLPPNFSRVDASGNVFFFGTKKIEIGSVEKYLTVKVGGGYLLLEEFCQRYTASESRKLDNFLCAPGVGRVNASSTQTGTHSAIGTPRFGTGMTPRQASGNGGLTPRGGSMPSSARSPQPTVPSLRR
jgi:Ca2+-binding EF-hand superfamily protein